MTASPAIGIAGQPVSSRIASIDIFRGLTMLVMIFVNDLADVKGLPWWTYHMHGNENGMTYVDMVYPAFLFVLGMSVPLSVEQRFRKNTSMTQLWLHVILRTIGLVVLGLILANAEKGNPALMHMSTKAWALAALTGAVLFWNLYGRSERYRTLFRTLKYSGLALIILTFAIFRRITATGQVAWLDTSYWEILGLIGWTYLAISILYIPTRNWLWARLLWFAALLVLNIFTAAHWLHFPAVAPFYFWPFGSGAFALISMGGIVTSTIFLYAKHWQTFRQKALPAFVFAGITLAAAWLLTPLGISKIRETPTWCLYSVGSSVLLFAVLYWICDVMKKTAWAAPVRSAGANTLLTYLLPDFFFFLLGGWVWLRQFNKGTAGVLKSIVVTGVMLAVSALLTKMKVRMQL